MYDPTLVSTEIMGTLQRYVNDRIPCGSFLTAVLENDLSEACARADNYNQRTLFHIVGYIYNELPRDCWGSPAKVKAWLRYDK